jgi:hypothetical protein
MQGVPATGSERQITRTVVLGIVTLLLYLGLFLFERPLLELSSRGGWYFLAPVAIAFAFSLVHGAFTGYFWDVLGIRAKK